MAQSVSVLYVFRNDRRWNANVNRLDYDVRWSAENRLILRHSHFLLCSMRRSFLFEVFLPPDQHLAGFY